MKVDMRTDKLFILMLDEDAADRLKLFLQHAIELKVTSEYDYEVVTKLFHLLRDKK